MPSFPEPVLETPIGETPDTAEFLAAAMRWHFGPETGSTFWLQRAATLGFDPVRDVRSLTDLQLFPNVVDELRTVPVEHLIPRGYGGGVSVFGVYESGGTTGSPKRLPFLADWMDRVITWAMRDMDARDHPRNVNWLTLVPSGPQLFGDWTAELVRRRGGVRFCINMDPRWVKRTIGAGETEIADRYVDHLIAQSAHILRSQQVGVLVSTPPLLERLCRDEELVDLINAKVRLIVWGGARMDPDTRRVLRTDVFPGVELYGYYGNVTMLGTTIERPGSDDARCIFDTFSPHIVLSVVDTATGEPVAYGEHGQVIVNHISRAMLLPNNSERDLAIRIEPPVGQLGDSVADITSMTSFAGETVIEGVY
ncbi:phenazine antibiotic biosynthesis protein [Streptomyces gardneri]|nr:phenazine antibiotic biosynthesis protein [Streptomyces gardneri]MBF6204070.1 phenazine antibiotic biosynthesis protein [Streptomyces gardneri]